MAKKRKSVSIGTTTRKPKPKMLHDGEHVASMELPNSLVPLEGCEDQDDLGLYHRWPLALLMQDRDRDDPAAVFVDTKRHHATYEYQWKDHPPTWMDPHLFAEMCQQDVEVLRICETAYKQNNPRLWERLLPELSRVFDEQYLPYVLEHFEQVASPFLAKWLLRCYAYQETDPNMPKKRTRRKRRKPVECAQSVHEDAKAS